MWLEAPFGNAAETMDPEQYGYVRNVEDNLLNPLMFTSSARPLDVPEPCKCKACSSSHAIAERTIYHVVIIAFVRITPARTL